MWYEFPKYIKLKMQKNNNETRDFELNWHGDGGESILTDVQAVEIH